MKVKILCTSGERYWYRNMIGKTFHVYRRKKGNEFEWGVQRKFHPELDWVGIRSKSIRACDCQKESNERFVKI